MIKSVIMRLVVLPHSDGFASSDGTASNIMANLS